MIWSILYCIVASLFFSFYYICHKRLRSKDYLYSDGDSVMFAVLLAIFWPATMWIGVPYILINIYKYIK